MKSLVTMLIETVADSGFAMGGADLSGGRVNIRRGCFSAKMYAKAKELGPGGAPPGSSTEKPRQVGNSYGEFLS